MFRTSIVRRFDVVAATGRFWGVMVGLLASLATSASAELLYATDGASIARFNSKQLNNVTTVAVTGMQPGEKLVGIDVRPANNLLYGVGNTNRVYTLDPLTGAAAQVGGASQFALSGTAFGVDFNPVLDRLRVVGKTGQNLRVSPVDGACTATDTTINATGNYLAIAHASNFPGATGCAFYALNAATGTLGVVGTPTELGPIVTLGSLGLGTNLGDHIGFDISGVTGFGYASLTVSGQSRLYGIHLSSGQATYLGTIGSGTTPYVGIAAAVAPEPSGVATLATAAVMCNCARRRPRCPV